MDHTKVDGARSRRKTKQKYKATRQSDLFLSNSSSVPHQVIVQPPLLNPSIPTAFDSMLISKVPSIRLARVRAGVGVRSCSRGRRDSEVSDGGSERAVSRSGRSRAGVDPMIGTSSGIEGLVGAGGGEELKRGRWKEASRQRCFGRREKRKVTHIFSRGVSRSVERSFSLG